MKYFKFILIPIVLAVVLFGFYYFGFAKKPVAIPEFETKYSEIGGITFTVTPNNFNNPAEFEIRIDTHSGSLNFDLTKISILEDGKSNQYQPVAWQGSAIEGHHISGTLIFPKFENKTDTMKLIIQDISPRVFEWQL